MRKSGRGFGRGYGRPWYRGSARVRPTDRASDDQSLKNSSLRLSSVSQVSVRAPSNQSPVTVHLNGCSATWRLYFPTEERTAEASHHIECFKAYIHKHRGKFDLEKIEQNRSAPLDLTELLRDEDFTTSWPKFREELFDKPEPTLRLLEFCLHESLSCEAKIRVRILNHEPVVPLSSLKVNSFGKLVTVKGTVIRVGSVGLICTSAAFQCSGCRAVQAVVQPQGVFSAPTFCNSCRSSSKLDPLQTSPFTITEDWQMAKIQETQSQSISGTIPRTVEVELQGDLVGSACPGDVLCVTGIVQVRGESRGGEDGRRAARLLQLYVHAVSVHSQRNLNSPTLSFTLTDYYAIQEIHGSEDVFRLLVHSLCPAIFGHEAVKAGLVLGLMGGTAASGAAGVRCDPHVLVVGDPGLGKSQLLQAAARAAPRGVYVCGASASAGGLTVALGREAGGDFALEAGALVLADRGVCCIDELDKMSAHHGSLLEAMEQGRVSVAKGGVVCSLAARATVAGLTCAHVQMSAHHGSLLEAMEQGRVSVAKGGVVCSLAARATVAGVTCAHVQMSAHHGSLLEAMEQGRVSVAKGGVVCSLAARATVAGMTCAHVQMSAHHGSLLEAMEQGRVSVAKGGVVCSLAARATVAGVTCAHVQMSAHHGSLLEAMEQGRVSVAKGGVVCSLAARATVAGVTCAHVQMSAHHGSLLEAMEQGRVSVAKGGVVYSLAARATVAGVTCAHVQMSAHHGSLLEAMEQGRVSVAKGGVVCSLAARATVLAAANPSAGNYNRAKTVVENLKINSALLSRFDLVYILLDQPDEKMDAMLSEHVLALHSGNKLKNSTGANALNIELSSQNDKDISLSKRLRLKPGEVMDTLPLVLLRKYIAYAKRYVHPKLSMDAAKKLQTFYLELRKNYQDGQNDGTPITTRQLEACVRLTQARARVDLREEATDQDAEDVISLMKHSLADTFSDEFGNIQLSRSIHGSGVSSRSALKRFLDVLTRQAHEMGKDVFSKQEMCQLHRVAGVPGEPNALIESMHVHSYLLLKGSNTYQLLAM